MDDEQLKTVAEALLRKLLEGGDVIEIREVPARLNGGAGRAWRIRLLTGDPAAA